MIVIVVSVVVGAIPYGLVWLFFQFIGVDMNHQLAIQISRTMIFGYFLVWWKRMRDPDDGPSQQTYPTPLRWLDCFEHWI